METIFVLHEQAVAGLRPVVDRVTLADLSRPTPCSGWDLCTLLEHMAGQDRGFAAAVRATTLGGDASAFAAHPVVPDPAAEIVAGLDEVVAAFAQARDLRRPVLMPEFGVRVPVTAVAGMHLVDTVVHGWDVAASLGTRHTYRAALDPDVVAAALSVAERIPDGDTREVPGSSFGPAVPPDADADAWTRLLGLLGRDPAWTTIRPTVRPTAG